MIRDFLGSHDQLVAEPRKIGVHLAEHQRTEGEGAGAREFDALRHDQARDRVLDDFGVHFERRDIRMLAERAQHGVRCVADAGLQRQNSGGMRPAAFSEARNSATRFPMRSVVASGSGKALTLSSISDSTMPTIFEGSTRTMEEPMRSEGL